MTVVDVNTGKFVGKGSGNLEETVTRNNLEAAEEIVRQLRLRDIGGIIVIDFIDMVLESNRELVLRRLTECLGRDRTKHQVAEVTSLGLVQMTRKRIGQGLLEAFSEPCELCNGRGVKVHLEPVEARSSARHSGENIDRVGAGRPRRQGQPSSRGGQGRARADVRGRGGEPPARRVRRGRRRQPARRRAAAEATADGPSAPVARRGRARATPSAEPGSRSPPTGSRRRIAVDSTSQGELAGTAG